MIGKLKALLFKGGGRTDKAENDDEAIRLATAALLAETAMMDGCFDEDERHVVLSILQRHFGLNEGEAQDLMEAGRTKVEDSSQLYGFTRTLKDHFSQEQRIAMIEMLWEVAYADGHVHHFESNLVRRVAGLIYVTDRESGEARKRVSRKVESGNQ
ncbi:MAG TPA: TerB family tellurite resistance protein [Rhodospirillales bacterium]|nr:TerB family tellurite resistance protein [Rhodospirillales bacterium]